MAQWAQLRALWWPRGMGWTGGERQPQEGENIGTHITDLHCWTPESNITLQLNYTPIKQSNVSEYVNDQDIERVLSELMTKLINCKKVDKGICELINMNKEKWIWKWISDWPKEYVQETIEISFSIRKKKFFILWELVFRRVWFTCLNHTHNFWIVLSPQEEFSPVMSEVWLFYLLRVGFGGSLARWPGLISKTSLPIQFSWNEKNIRNRELAGTHQVRPDGLPPMRYETHRH